MNDNAAEKAGSANGDGFGVYERTYRPEQVVCVRCEHVREMKGETDEIVRRTRSDAAENAVLEVVRRSGYEPDWFVERWVAEVDGGGALVACAVFEAKERADGFREAVRGYCDGKDGGVVIELREDAELSARVAELFTAEWARRRKEQMGRLEAVLEDAVKGGRYVGRVVVGECDCCGGKDAKAAFGEVCERLNDAFPHDVYGEGGIVYSGYWDGDVARFAFGFADEAACDAGKDALDRAGARFYDPMVERAEGVEMEMAAYVVAKMQADERAKEERERLEKEIDERVVAAKDGKMQDADELVD